MKILTKISECKYFSELVVVSHWLLALFDGIRNPIDPVGNKIDVRELSTSKELLLPELCGVPALCEIYWLSIALYPHRRGRVGVQVGLTLIQEHLIGLPGGARRLLVHAVSSSVALLDYTGGSVLRMEGIGSVRRGEPTVGESIAGREGVDITPGGRERWSKERRRGNLFWRFLLLRVPLVHCPPAWGGRSKGIGVHRFAKQRFLGVSAIYLPPVGSLVLLLAVPVQVEVLDDLWHAVQPPFRLWRLLPRPFLLERPQGLWRHRGRAGVPYPLCGSGERCPCGHPARDRSFWLCKREVVSWRRAERLIELSFNCGKKKRQLK